ncbi:MAG TPA: hypothetical protein VKE94_21695 [Gemmataceae bacterium]|nr:hypothetical protein [Gemmataceae bacterium]
MNVYMPNVETAGNLDELFAKARQMSNGEHAPPGYSNGRSAALVTPGRLVMAIPCPPSAPTTPGAVEGVRRLVPLEPKQTITVIAFNDLVKFGSLSPLEVNAHIPFLGYLLGMVFDGHTVVIFEGHPTALAAGCRGATLLIVDEVMVPLLQKDWPDIASKSMQLRPRLLIMCRDGTTKELVPNVPQQLCFQEIVTSQVISIARSETTRPRKRWWWPFGSG